MTISTIRTGLAANLATVSGLNTYATVQGKPEPPCAIVLPGEPFGIPESMARGIWTWNFRVLILTGSVDDPSAQDALDDYLKSSGTGSIPTAIESDKTLGGAASNATFSQITTYGDVEWNDLRYWGAELLVRVLATG